MTDKQQLIERIGSITVGKEPHPIKHLLGAAGIDAIATAWLEDRKKTRLEMAQEIIAGLTKPKENK